MEFLLKLFFKRKTKILFYGHRGWIGGLFLKFIEQQFPDVIVVKGDARLENKTSVLTEIYIHSPTHIVTFTGRTHGKIENQVINTIDYLEYPGKIKENIQDNLFGPVQLAAICQKKGIHYTYLGTGCIFNSLGLETEFPQKFTETSPPNYFGSGYSVVKGFTDQLLQNFPVLNLRIRMPISSESNSRNFINKITTYEKICSIKNSMTVLDDFFPIFMDMLLHNKTGTYNCTNPGTISHNEILEMYREIVNPDFTWKNFTIQEQALILKSDRSNNALDTHKLENEYNLPSIKEAVMNILKKF
jgi:3,5-epimerase/4-reductase